MDSTRVISGVKDITRVDPPFRRVETPPHFRYIAKLAFKNKVVSQGIRQ